MLWCLINCSRRHRDILILIIIIISIISKQKVWVYRVYALCPTMGHFYDNLFGKCRQFWAIFFSVIARCPLRKMFRVLHGHHQQGLRLQPHVFWSQSANRRMTSLQSNYLAAHLFLTHLATVKIFHRVVCEMHAKIYWHWIVSQTPANTNTVRSRT